MICIMMAVVLYSDYSGKVLPDPLSLKGHAGWMKGKQWQRGHPYILRTLLLFYHLSMKINTHWAAAVANVRVQATEFIRVRL